jgi:hypothetical protein
MSEVIVSQYRYALPPPVSDRRDQDAETTKCQRLESPPSFDLRFDLHVSGSRIEIVQVGDSNVCA